MAKSRLEERISGNVGLELTSADDNKIELINCSKLFDKEKEKRPFATYPSIVFDFNSLILSHQLSSLNQRNPPVKQIGQSESQKIAAELELQQTKYTIDNNYAALLTFHIESSLFSAFTREVYLHNLGSTAYLPLIVPYLSDSLPMTTDEKLIIYISLYMKPAWKEVNEFKILGSYSGTISYIFEEGEHKHSVRFEK